jgi:hypothetical protein
MDAPHGAGSVGKYKIFTGETKIRRTGWFGSISRVIGQFIGAEVIEGHTLSGDDVVLDQALRSLLHGDVNVPRR